MTLEERVTQVLRSVCPRSYRGIAPAMTDLPYVTYQKLGGQELQFMDGSLGSKRSALMQINVWAESELVSDPLMEEIGQALIAAPGLQASPEGAARDAVDSEIDRCGTTQDWTIWADR